MPPWTSFLHYYSGPLCVLFIFVHFPYANIYELELSLQQFAFVPSLWWTYILPFIALLFPILQVVVLLIVDVFLNGPNPEGFCSVSPTCLLNEIIFVTAKHLFPEL